MRFSAQLPTDRVTKGAEFTSAAAIGEMARALEAAGFDAAFATEHPFPPAAWLAAGGHHALDPFVVLAAAAAASSRLRLHTNVLVLAYRNPFLLAKAVASLDAISGGRVIVGVAAGYLEGEFAALGADFAQRNERADDALVALKLAWSGAEVTHAGPDYRASGNRMLPAPLQRPHPPLWVGGNSRRAARRAARYGQGWSPFPAPAAVGRQTRTAAIESIADLALRIRELREYAEEIGREGPLDVNFVPFEQGMNPRALPDPDRFCEQISRLSEIGVSWLSVGLPSASRAGYCESAARFGESVIARLRRAP
jgi:probable F420-dependent oxidoreductase